jgi:hypothetical protein
MTLTVDASRKYALNTAASTIMNDMTEKPRCCGMLAPKIVVHSRHLMLLQKVTDLFSLYEPIFD